MAEAIGLYLGLLFVSFVGAAKLAASVGFASYWIWGLAIPGHFVGMVVKKKWAAVISWASLCITVLFGAAAAAFLVGHPWPLYAVLAAGSITGMYFLVQALSDRREAAGGAPVNRVVLKTLGFGAFLAVVLVFFASGVLTAYQDML